jgi:hypothetical protein
VRTVLGEEDSRDSRGTVAGDLGGGAAVEGLGGGGDKEVSAGVFVLGITGVH